MKTIKANISIMLLSASPGLSPIRKLLPLNKAYGRNRRGIILELPRKTSIAKRASSDQPIAVGKPTSHYSSGNLVSISSVLPTYAVSLASLQRTVLGYKSRARIALIPGTKLGPDEIQSRLGAGGMGKVYRAGMRGATVQSRSN